ncbi:branched-chain amino acid ABC transporter permease [Pseudonocardia sp. RS010]|uniref:branched-chain amino acid ABC transporter permease n=1 Tax=Pseudonocardia sp. RS010 TaxID=3385979 RepID=UPI0039A36B72
MSTVVFLLIGGVSIGALYFLLASGLGLIFGLMRVLSFAHGALLAACGYASWLVVRSADLTTGSTTGAFVLSVVVAVVVGAVLAFLVEYLLIRPLYDRSHLDQILVTMGFGFLLVALVRGIWGPDEKSVPLPEWLRATTDVGGALIPNDRWLLIIAAVLLLVAIQLFLRHTRHGLIVRAGVENREMVRALGIEVRHSFTLVFVIGGAAAGLGGVLAGAYARAINPGIGDTFLLFAFIVLIVGGLGSLTGAAIAAVVIGVLQQFANFYVDPGAGDILAVVLMAVTLLVRPQGIAGRKERTI